jgi:hypothetical protein
MGSPACSQAWPGGPSAHRWRGTGRGRAGPPGCRGRPAARPRPPWCRRGRQVPMPRSHSYRRHPMSGATCSASVAPSQISTWLRWHQRGGRPRPDKLSIRDDHEGSHHPGGGSARPLPRRRRLVVPRRLVAAGLGLLALRRLVGISSVDMGGRPWRPVGRSWSPPARQVSAAAFPARRSHPGGQPASQVDAHHRTGLVAGGQAPPPFDTAAGGYRRW